MKYFYKIRVCHFIKPVIASLILFLTVGCCCRPPVPVAESACCDSAQQMKWRDTYREKLMGVLQKNQIGVVTLGETKRIIIPEESIFFPYSSNLLPVQKDRLNTVAKLICSYDVILVRVDAYADSQFPESVARALTEKQAKTVSDYLKMANMDARLIVNYGHGTENLVASNATTQGRFFNRRIEITFRIYPYRPMY